MSRQQLRRHRLLELEKEQHLEDAEAFVITEEQRRLLLSSFMSVKFEFHDLDGLRWTQTALRRRQHHRPSIFRPTRSDHTFVVSTNTRSTIHDIEATIRGYVDCLPSDFYQSSKLKKSKKSRPPIASQSPWNGDGEISTLTSSFPLPPSTLPPSTCWKAPYTIADNQGLMNSTGNQIQVCVVSGQPVSPFASSDPSEHDNFFYDSVVYAASPMGPTGAPLPLPRPRWAHGVA